MRFVNQHGKVGLAGCIATVVPLRALICQVGRTTVGDRIYTILGGGSREHT